MELKTARVRARVRGCARDRGPDRTAGPAQGSRALPVPGSRSRLYRPPDLWGSGPVAARLAPAERRGRAERVPADPAEPGGRVGGVGGWGGGVGAGDGKGSRRRRRASIRDHAAARDGPDHRG